MARTKVGKKVSHPRMPCYWLVTFRENGQLVVAGRYEDEFEARRVGQEKLHGNYQVFELMTRDRNRATAAIKYKILEQTGNLELALKKASHKI